MRDVREGRDVCWPSARHQRNVSISKSLPVHPRLTFRREKYLLLVVAARGRCRRPTPPPRVAPFPFLSLKLPIRVDPAGRAWGFKRRVSGAPDVRRKGSCDRGGCDELRTRVAPSFRCASGLSRDTVCRMLQLLLLSSQGKGERCLNGTK